MLNHEEQQQWLLIKAWLKRYRGVIIIISIALLLTVSFWTAWQSHQTEVRQQTSHLYQTMLNKAQAKQPWQQQALFLIQHYGHTVYADFAAFKLAQWHVNHHELVKAQHNLEWIKQHGYDARLRQLATWRLARVLLAQKLPLQTLSHVKKQAYVDHRTTWFPLFILTQADAYRTLKQYPLARSAYAQVLHFLPQDTWLKPLTIIQLSSM